VVSGCLLAYAADLQEEARRGAGSVDRILRGTQSRDLPIEQMSTYKLNLTTAKVFGLALPNSLLVRADAVIE
jgi:putative tryptophan/tyrosine transport system substrate-binding protein